jgi:hypothetical protein
MEAKKNYFLTVSYTRLKFHNKEGLFLFHLEMHKQPCVLSGKFSVNIAYIGEILISIKMNYILCTNKNMLVI